MVNYPCRGYRNALLFASTEKDANGTEGRSRMQSMRGYRRDWIEETG